MTIKARLWLLTAGVLLAVVLMAGFSYQRGKALIRDQFDEAGMAAAKSAAQNVDRYLFSIAQIARNTADRVGYDWSTRGITAEDVIEETLVSAVGINKDAGIQDIYFGLDATGRVADGVHWKEPSDYDIHTRPWFKEAVAANKPVFTTPYVDTNTKQLVITAAVPVFDAQAKFIGVIGADVNIDALSKFVTAQKVLGRGSGFLVNGLGIVLAHSSPEWRMKENVKTGSSKVSPELLEIGAKMLAGETGMGTFPYEGKTQRVYYAPTGDGFSVAIAFDQADMEALARSSLMGQLLIAALAVIAVVLLVLSIGSGLNRSIRDLREAAGRLAQGDLTVRFDRSRRDETGQIGTALDDMGTNLRESLRHIADAAARLGRQSEDFAAMAEETGTGVREIRDRAEEVRSLMEGASAATEEINASSEEVAAGAQTSAERSTDMATRAEEARKVGEQGATALKGLVQSIEDASRETRESAASVKGLGERARQIQGLVSQIGGIADQTNLLALNAAIEAARAGEAGRGFAVVAEEVRKLAEESNGAAQSIADLAGAISTDLDKVLGSVQRGAEASQDSSGRARETQETIQRMLEALRTIASATQDLAAVSEEQSASSQEIASAVQDTSVKVERGAAAATGVKDSVSRVSTAMEKVAGNAQDLARLSENLSDLVRAFKLGEEVDALRSDRTGPAALPGGSTSRAGRSLGR
jgi:methyl-accepting chemotaxis protein